METNHHAIESRSVQEKARKRTSFGDGVVIEFRRFRGFSNVSLKMFVVAAKPRDRFKKMLRN